jgi:hypothetical protein
MKDDAIAPVVAVMLILAAIVTFFSIWNAIYVPSMKESAEADHLHNVEESFQKFSSDIDYAASSHQNNLVFSEPVQLGGGDVLVNLLKSSGTLDVDQDRNQTRESQSTLYKIAFFYGTTPIEENGTLINFSYEPVGNFWQDQGYQWQYGYINVTKNDGELKTPLSYDTMDHVTNATESGPLALFAKSFANVDYTLNQTEMPVYPTTTLEQPVVTSISPKAGPLAGGTPVIITGVGFTGATNVWFGGTPNTTGEMMVNSDTSITVVSPAEAAGTADVTVTTPYPGGTSNTSSADWFTYTAAPTVTGVSPTAGGTAGGTPVTITGFGFTGATNVMFGNYANATGAMTVNSDTSITVTSPPVGEAGTVDVTVTTPQGRSATTSADQFTYAAIPVIVVTGVSPNAGPPAGGTLVTITGVGFTGATTVKFNGQPNATGAMTVNSDTSITVYCPGPAGVSGDVTVTTPVGTSASNSPADWFTYTALPSITGISPTAGSTAGGTPVTITGVGFTGANDVMFGETPNATGAMTVNSDTSITVTSPAEAAGTVDITVTTPYPGGTSASSPVDKFTYSKGLLPTPIQLPTSYSAVSGSCSNLDLWAVNITASPDHSFISSNGYGTLKLTSNVTSIPIPYPVTHISFGSDQEPFGNTTVDGLNETFFDKVSVACSKNMIVPNTATNPLSHYYEYDIYNQIERPVYVTLHIVEIQVEAY